MCGIIAVCNEDDSSVANDLYLGLSWLQHRGKESAAIAIAKADGGISRFGGVGEVPQAFHGLDLETISGATGIGQVRYSTAGTDNDENLQPIRGEFHGREFYVVHNGNLINTVELRRQVNGPEMLSDTALTARLVSQTKTRTFEDALIQTTGQLRGAFNFIFLFQNTTYILTDKFGFHPLQIGRREKGWVIASESCVFDLLGAYLFQDIPRGHLLIVKPDSNHLQWLPWIQPATDLKFDLFEFVYFLRPDSIIHGVEVGAARYHMGRFLAQEHPVDVDLIISTPDSGNEAARGFWQELVQQGQSQVDFHPWALFRPHTTSRTFIEPVQKHRQQYLRLKLNPRPRQLHGKRVAIVDDSRVRGNVTEAVTKLLRQAGAVEVHMRAASPPYRHPDIYGIDTHRHPEELEARRLKTTDPRVLQHIYGLNSLAHLSLEKTIKGVLRAQNSVSDLTTDTFYTGPFSGQYPDGQGDYAHLFQTD